MQLVVLRHNAQSHLAVSQFQVHIAKLMTTCIRTLLAPTRVRWHTMAWPETDTSGGRGIESDPTHT